MLVTNASSGVGSFLGTVELLGLVLAAKTPRTTTTNFAEYFRCIDELCLSPQYASPERFGGIVATLLAIGLPAQARTAFNLKDVACGVTKKYFQQLSNITVANQSMLAKQRQHASSPSMCEAAQDNRKRCSIKFRGCSFDSFHDQCELQLSPSTVIGFDFASGLLKDSSHIATLCDRFYVVLSALHTFSQILRNVSFAGESDDVWSSFGIGIALCAQRANVLIDALTTDVLAASNLPSLVQKIIDVTISINRPSMTSSLYMLTVGALAVRLGIDPQQAISQSLGHVHEQHQQGQDVPFWMTCLAAHQIDFLSSISATATVPQVTKPSSLLLALDIRLLVERRGWDYISDTEKFATTLVAYCKSLSTIYLFDDTTWYHGAISMAKRCVALWHQAPEAVPRRSTDATICTKLLGFEPPVTVKNPVLLRISPSRPMMMALSAMVHVLCRDKTPLDLDADSIFAHLFGDVLSTLVQQKGDADTNDPSLPLTFLSMVAVVESRKNVVSPSLLLRLWSTAKSLLINAFQAPPTQPAHLHKYAINTLFWFGISAVHRGAECADVLEECLGFLMSQWCAKADVCQASVQRQSIKSSGSLRQPSMGAPSDDLSTISAVICEIGATASRTCSQGCVSVSYLVTLRSSFRLIIKHLGVREVFSVSLDQHADNVHERIRALQLLFAGSSFYRSQLLGVLRAHVPRNDAQQFRTDEVDGVQRYAQLLTTVRTFWMAWAQFRASIALSTFRRNVSTAAKGMSLSKKFSSRLGLKNDLPSSHFTEAVFGDVICVASQLSPPFNLDDWFPRDKLQESVQQGLRHQILPQNSGMYCDEDGSLKLGETTYRVLVDCLQSWGLGDNVLATTKHDIHGEFLLMSLAIVELECRRIQSLENRVNTPSPSCTRAWSPKASSTVVNLFHNIFPLTRASPWPPILEAVLNEITNALFSQMTKVSTTLLKSPAACQKHHKDAGEIIFTYVAILLNEQVDNLMCAPERRVKAQRQLLDLAQACPGGPCSPFILSVLIHLVDSVSSDVSGVGSLRKRSQRETARQGILDFTSGWIRKAIYYQPKTFYSSILACTIAREASSHFTDDTNVGDVSQDTPRDTAILWVVDQWESAAAAHRYKPIEGGLCYCAPRAQLLDPRTDKSHDSSQPSFFSLLEADQSEQLRAEIETELQFLRFSAFGTDEKSSVVEPSRRMLDAAFSTVPNSKALDALSICMANSFKAIVAYSHYKDNKYRAWVVDDICALVDVPMTGVTNGLVGTALLIECIHRWYKYSGLLNAVCQVVGESKLGSLLSTHIRNSLLGSLLRKWISVSLPPFVGVGSNVLLSVDISLDGGGDDIHTSKHIDPLHSLIYRNEHVQRQLDTPQTNPSVHSLKPVGDTQTNVNCNQLVDCLLTLIRCADHEANPSLVGHCPVSIRTLQVLLVGYSQCQQVRKSSFCGYLRKISRQRIGFIMAPSRNPLMLESTLHFRWLLCSTLFAYTPACLPSTDVCDTSRSVADPSRVHFRPRLSSCSSLSSSRASDLCLSAKSVNKTPKTGPLLSKSSADNVSSTEFADPTRESAVSRCWAWLVLTMCRDCLMFQFLMKPHTSTDSVDSNKDYPSQSLDITSIATATRGAAILSRLAYRLRETSLLLRFQSSQSSGSLKQLRTGTTTTASLTSRTTASDNRGWVGALNSARKRPPKAAETDGDILSLLELLIRDELATATAWSARASARLFADQSITTTDGRDSQEGAFDAKATGRMSDQHALSRQNDVSFLISSNGGRMWAPGSFDLGDPDEGGSTSDPGKKTRKSKQKTNKRSSSSSSSSSSSETETVGGKHKKHHGPRRGLEKLLLPLRKKKIWKRFIASCWMQSPALAGNLVERFQSRRTVRALLALFVESNSYPVVLASCWFPDSETSGLLDVVIATKLRPDADPLLPPPTIHFFSSRSHQSRNVDTHSRRGITFPWTYKFALPARTVLATFTSSLSVRLLLRRKAICALAALPSNVWKFYLPQVLQALRSDNGRIIFSSLRDMALVSPGLGQLLIFAAATELEGRHSNKLDMLASECACLIGSVFDEMPTRASQSFNQQFRVFDGLSKLSGTLMSVPIEDRERIMNNKISEIANEFNDSSIPLFLPTSPYDRVVKIKADSGRLMRSAAKVPIMLSFETVHFCGIDLSFQQSQLESYDAADIGLSQIIFKLNDDVRQDRLALQVIQLCQCVFEEQRIDLRLVPYNVVSHRTLGLQGGMIGVVANSMSRDQMGKLFDCSICDYFVRKFTENSKPTFAEAQFNFIRSLAAYSVISFVLQIKDRHNGNLLITDDGLILHIDFGFLFDTSPGGDLGFEKAPFKLTQEMLDLMERESFGKKEKNQITGLLLFRHFCVQGYLALRRHAPLILHLVACMLESGLPCFKKKSLSRLRHRLQLDSNGKQAADFMETLIDRASRSITTKLYDIVQRLQQGIAH